MFRDLLFKPLQGLRKSKKKWGETLFWQFLNVKFKWLWESISLQSCDSGNFYLHVCLNISTVKSYPLFYYPELMPQSPPSFLWVLIGGPNKLWHTSTSAFPCPNQHSLALPHSLPHVLLNQLLKSSLLRLWLVNTVKTCAVALESVVMSMQALV